MTKKTLKDILGEGYLDDMQTSDTVDFVKKHTIDNEPVKKDKKVGTDSDEVFKASNVKQVKRAPRHGHDTEKSKDVYEALDSDVTSPSSMGISAPSYAVPTPKKRPEDLKTNSEKPVIPNTAGNSAVTKTGPQSSTVKKNTIDVNTRKVSEEVEEKEDYSDLVKKHLDAANKAKEYMDKGDLKNAKKHVEIMKDLSKQMAEEVEHDDDGWYAHREIHGNKGISREDWKKGWRLNLKGERVQTKKANEEVEQIEETKHRELAAKHLELSGKKAPYGTSTQALRIIVDRLKADKEKNSASMKKEEVEQIDETHRVGVTYSDPNSSSVSARKEQMFKNVRVKADSEDDAIAKAKKHFKTRGYKVHNAEITTMKEEVEQVDEAVS